MAILKQVEAGINIPDLCREHGISIATFYKWCSKFGGMDTSMIKRLKKIEEENRRLKKMFAEETLISKFTSEHAIYRSHAPGQGRRLQEKIACFIP
jgi:putative transposase